MTVCPNTSPLLVLARLDRLDLLGDPPSVALTAAVVREVRDKDDDATRRIEGWIPACGGVFEPVVPTSIDPGHDLGGGERSVLAFALAAGGGALCVLDDAAARAEARRLGLSVTGTLGLILRAKVDGRLPTAAPLLREALAAGLYLDDGVMAAALARVGESWGG